ncbi:MAG TPA: NCS2 family permease [Candidatus Limnocylindrales bacterium]|nr:NCS2 family permease [Candidatus Limnocylindrales bacterium]
MEAIARYFKFAERGTDFGTEIRAGLTTFLVMAYIVFLNPIILADGFKVVSGYDLNITQAAATTALVAGVLTIAMGVFTNYPFAMAAGLGLNAVVAFGLTSQGLSPAGAMGVVVLEGLAILALVVLGLREAIMNAVPLALKRAIGVGIGLFILFIGFVDARIIQIPASKAVPVEFVLPTTPAHFVFFLGLALTIALWVMRVRGALLISILVTTAVAVVAGVQKIPAEFTVIPSFFPIVPDLSNVFNIGLVAALLTIFAIMLSDFFDTMGTVTGVAAEAGLTDEEGRVPGIGPVLLVDSLGAVAGGAAGISSNTTYIESAAGVAEGGRTGFTAVVVGVLFLVAILAAPLVQLIPFVATGPVLVLVGYLMFVLVRDIPVTDVEEGIPALLTMIMMPLTFSITNGIGAGFVAWVFIKVVRRKWAEIHPLMWVVAIAFVVYFLNAYIQTFI